MLSLSIYLQPMKKALSFLLPVLVLMLVGSCKGKTDSFRIGVSQCSYDDWRKQMNREMLREATFYNKKVQLDIRSAFDSNERQIAQIDSLVDEGIDLLIVSPNEARPLTETIERVHAKGIPVVVVDRKIASDKYTAFVGADNRSIGRDVAAYVIRTLGGKGTVVEFTGNMESTAAQERHQGFAEGLAKEPNVRVVAQVEAGWEGDNVQRQVDSLFRAGVYPDIVFAPNDRTGLRIRRAAQKLGHNLKVIGVDGLSAPGGGLENVEKGELAASFVYPTGGDKVIQAAMNILERKPYKRDTHLASAVIDPSTMRVFRMQSNQVAENEWRIDELGAQLDKFLSRYSMQKMLLIAAVIIIVLIGIVFAMGLRSYFTTIRRNAELARQKQKLEEQRDRLVEMSKELQESTQSKIDFFTEVSHDLRTPLTLIIAPIEQLQTAENLTAAQRELLQTVRTNSDILLRLVGQTLDFSKFEAGQLRLSLTTTEVASALRDWCEPFKALAKKKMIRFKVSVPEASSEGGAPEATFDEQKMERVVYNLLSNAFKFTPEGGKISVDATIQEDADQNRRLCIVIADSGMGIDRDKLPHIFNRYYQADVSRSGSGIGLATVKAIVELHGGTVCAESLLGNGSRFTVVIPCDPHVDEEITELSDPVPTIAETVFVEPNGIENSVEPAAKPTEKVSMQTAAITHISSEEDTQLPTVLIIDDNEDIRAYIRQLLDGEFIVEEAVNGEEGLTKARQLIPDAVVCDVMMPVMDGWECCRRLKDGWQTSHIPVMMLTACAQEQQRIMGFNCGADAYVPKPFSPEVFRTRLRNLIANRRRLRVFFGDNASLATADVSELDKGFAERFRQLIEKRLGNAELSVEDLASEMGLGRSQLYRKVKSLTGFSPVEIVRIARLKRAAKLFTTTEKTVSEVAYEVGFSTPGYLTKCFREYFGVNPTDYAKSK